MMKGQTMRAVMLYQGFQPCGTAARESASPSADAKKGIFRRIFTALERSRQRYIDREVARFIAGRGDRLTDEVERQLFERFTNGGFPPYA
jgi:hypothetical protein